MSRSCIATLLLLWLLALHVQADDIVMPVGGKCETEYLLFEGVCLSQSALSRLTTAEMVSKIYKFKEAQRDSAIADGSQVICQTEVRDKDGDYFKLANGAVAEKTSYGYVGYISYGTEALLIYSGTLGSILVEESLIEVELIRPPTHCDSPPLYVVDAVTSDKAIINGERFEIWGFCSGLSAGDQVVFSNSSAAWGVCLSTDIYNLSSGGDSCKLFCQ